MLRQHAGPIEADLQRYYGIDLSDLWRGQLSPRRLGVLVANLPDGAATFKAIGSDGAWSAEAHLLALLADLTNGANWQRGGGKGAKPKPFDRPSDAHAKALRAERNTRRANAFLIRRRNRNEEVSGDA